MAMFMSILTIFAAAVCADGGQKPLMRVLALFSFVLAVPLLLKAHSAGALVTTILSFAILGITVLFGRMSRRERMMILVCALILALPLAGILAALACNGTIGTAFASFLSGVLGKDPTLTGRTVLWGIALNQISLHPWLGGGYCAFWIQGNLLPEGIWRDFQIDSRSGFTFHDTYLNFAVDLGWTGVAALVITLWLGLERAVRMALALPGWTSACFVTVLFCLLTRSIGEVDLPSPFAIGTYLFFVIASYGADYARTVQAAERAPVRAYNPVRGAGMAK